MRLILGDAAETMATLPADSIDAVITDPPYGLKFMGKACWDKAVPSVAVWREALRVLKPGAFAFIMSGTRQDCLVHMLENLAAAGFNTGFTSLYWTYATGMPKGKRLGCGGYAGYQPKPAIEIILVVMKPLSEKNYTAQAATNGKGVTWLGNCRTNERYPANLLVSNNALGKHSRFFSLDAWAQTLPFLVVPKTSKAEKNAGLAVNPIDNTDKYNGKFPNAKADKQTAGKHPTIKPLALMSYLITLATRENDTVLDCFVGSGTTAIAAKQLNRHCIGIDNNAEYLTIAKARVEHATAG
jgi:site-specific DNA-methyltransferase (adenine-specific)